MVLLPFPGERAVGDVQTWDDAAGRWRPLARAIGEVHAPDDARLAFAGERRKAASLDLSLIHI